MNKSVPEVDLARSGVGRRTFLAALGTAGASLGVAACTSSSTAAASADSTTASTTAASTGATSAAGTVTATTSATDSTTPPATGPSSTSVSTSASAPAAATEGQVTAAGVERALTALPDVIARGMATTGVPGLAMAVVYDGRVRYLAGHGVRMQGKADRVDPDTVFYLASVSKPIASTVIAAARTGGPGLMDWNDTLASRLPGFTLSDPWVGAHVTVADMFSHRSGLPDHAGNLLEDLGFDRTQILAKLARYPLGRFRDDYEYTNYGLTAGAQAFATSAKKDWNTLSRDALFTRLGMTSTSYAYADLTSRKDRAALHARVDGRFVAGPDADYEGQAPAGSASSSVRDLATWLTMLLAGGTHAGTEIISPEELVRIFTPASLNHPPADVATWGTFYGYGWNVGYQKTGDLQLTHSGAFARGASTAVTVLPAGKLGLVVLSNAAPVGLPEAIGAEFVDLVRYGKSTRDWLSFIGPFVEQQPTEDQLKYEKAAVGPKPARGSDVYAGTYANSLYGPLTVARVGSGLTLSAGPHREKHPLTHYSGDEFFFPTTGEDATGLTGVVFTGSGATAASVTVNAWNASGLGTFTRA